MLCIVRNIISSTIRGLRTMEDKSHNSYTVLCEYTYTDSGEESMTLLLSASSRPLVPKHVCPPKLLPKMRAVFGVNRLRVFFYTSKGGARAVSLSPPRCWQACRLARGGSRLLSICFDYPIM